MGKKRVSEARHKIICLNLGWMKIVGELGRRTKDYIMVKNVLEIRINQLTMQVGVFPIDYPLNTASLEYMKVYDFRLEYPNETVDLVTDKYYIIRKYLETGKLEPERATIPISDEVLKKMLEENEIQ